MLLSLKKRLLVLLSILTFVCNWISIVQFVTKSSWHLICTFTSSQGIIPIFQLPSRTPDASVLAFNKQELLLPILSIFLWKRLSTKVTTYFGKWFFIFCHNVQRALRQLNKYGIPNKISFWSEIELGIWYALKTLSIYFFFRKDVLST